MLGPVPLVIFIVFLVIAAIPACLLGALAGGGIVALLTKRSNRFMANAILGGVSFIVVLLVAILLKWPRTTITYQNGSSMTIAHYPYPATSAYIAAVVVPILSELVRYRRK